MQWVVTYMLLIEAFMTRNKMQWLLKPGQSTLKYFVCRNTALFPQTLFQSKLSCMRTLYFQVSWPPDTTLKQVVPQTLYFKADCPLKRDTIYTKGGHFAYLQVKCLGVVYFQVTWPPEHFTSGGDSARPTMINSKGTPTDCNFTLWPPTDWHQVKQWTGTLFCLY